MIFQKEIKTSEPSNFLRKLQDDESAPDENV
jgi:hypothetical protein